MKKTTFTSFLIFPLGGDKGGLLRGVGGLLYAALIACTITATLFTACGKKDNGGGTKDNGGGTKTYPEENPLAGFFKAVEFEKQEAKKIGYGGGLDAGFIFTPLVTGKINAITLKMPFSGITGNLDIPVSLWGLDPQKSLRTITIPYATVKAGETTTQTIEPIFLTKNKQYVISFYIRDILIRNFFADCYYYSYTTVNKKIHYPVIVGNISINNTVFLIQEGVRQIPSKTTDLGFYGDISFVFQQTE